MVDGTEAAGPEPGTGSKPVSACETAGDRVRFTVELRPGETTIVSWKKLLREANLSESRRPEPSGTGPSYEAQRQDVSPPPPPMAPCSSKQTAEDEPNDSQTQAGSNRLSTVIERIERMYAGNGSSDEEDLALDNVPDDDEYDTEDSFIDDTELDDYFQVDNSAIKHDGFFVNRGKLERIEPTICANQQQKKRRRKDLTKGGQNDDGHNAHKIMRMGNKGRKASSSIQRSSTTQSHKEAMPNLDMLVQDSPANVAEVSSENKTADIPITVDPSKLLNGDAIRQDVHTDQQRPGVASKNHVRKFKESKLQDTSTQRLNDKISNVSRSHSGKQLDNIDDLDLLIQQKEKGGHFERFDLNVPASRAFFPTTKAAPMQRKEGSSFRPKSTSLEKSIRDLEKMVAECRPPSAEALDPDNSSQAVKRRLPPEIKEKLAKVADSAQTIYGYIPNDLISRLMDIVGHLMRVRTLKRNLKVMANMGLSAKREKDDRIQKIKQEVVEMVKLLIPHMKSKIEHNDANGDNFREGPEEKEALKRKYSMDDILENKICDLYDLYVERLEEDSGPPVRRLYEELALLWPSGFMHADGIKRAIYRAKERKGLYSLRKDREKIKKKKVLVPNAEDAINAAQASHIHEKSSSGSHDHGCTLTNNPFPSATASHVATGIPVGFVNGPNLDKPKQEKTKKRSSSSNPTDAQPSNVSNKNKIKKKPTADVAETQFRLEKLAVSQVKKRPKHHKHLAAPLTKSNFEAAGPSGPELTFSSMKLANF